MLSSSFFCRNLIINRWDIKALAIFRNLLRNAYRTFFFSLSLLWKWGEEFLQSKTLPRFEEFKKLSHTNESENHSPKAAYIFETLCSWRHDCVRERLEVAMNGNEHWYRNIWFSKPFSYNFWPLSVLFPDKIYFKKKCCRRTRDTWIATHTRRLLN